MERSTDLFIQLLTDSQPALYASIRALVPDREAAREVLQETNLTLWHKAKDYEAGTSFLSWATSIARYHVLNYRRKQKREKLIFSEELVQELSAAQSDFMNDVDSYVTLLRGCLEKLPAEQLELITLRYSGDSSVQQIADSKGRTVGAISQLLYRIREVLLNCIKSQLQKGMT